MDTPRTVRLAMVGDRDPERRSHRATEAAVAHAAAAVGAGVELRWFATEGLAGQALAGWGADGVFVAPGSPYASMGGALDAIRHAREVGLPLLGTCGGFQHVVLELARTVLGIHDASHAEYGAGGRAVVVPLACSLAGETAEVRLAAGSRLREICGAVREEPYLCRFGLDPAHEPALEEAGLRIVGRDADGQARAVELVGHPFFVATLYVPQLASTAGRPHPVVTAWIEAATRGRPDP